MNEQLLKSTLSNKFILIISLLLFPISLFSQTFEINETISDFDLVIGTKSVKKEMTSFYGVEHGIVYYNSDYYPNSTTIKAEFFENGLIKEKSSISADGNEKKSLYEYDQNWNCIKNGYVEATYDENNRIKTLNWGIPFYTYYYQNDDYLIIEKGSQYHNRIDYQHIFYFNDKIILSYTYDSHDELDGYYTYAYNSKGEMLKYERYGKQTINSVTSFVKSIEEENIFDENLLKKHFFEIDAVQGRLKRITYYDENSKIQKFEEYEFINEEFVLKFFIKYEYENDLEKALYFDIESNLEKTVIKNYDQKKLTSEITYSPDNKILERSRYQYDLQGNIIESISEQLYEENLVVISEQIWEYIYY